jgi:hypothetical protein
MNRTSEGCLAFGGGLSSVSCLLSDLLLFPALRRLGTPALSFGLGRDTAPLLSSESGRLGGPGLF